MEPGAVEMVSDTIPGWLRLVVGTPRQPIAVMPGYYRLSGLTLVAAVYATKSVLATQEIEFVAYLMTLRVDKR
jgi:hypothetical protein